MKNFKTLAHTHTPYAIGFDTRKKTLKFYFLQKNSTFVIKLEEEEEEGGLRALF